MNQWPGCRLALHMLICHLNSSFSLYTSHIHRPQNKYCYTPSMLEKKVILERTRSPKHNLTSYFYKKIFTTEWYIYIFMKLFSKRNLFIWFLYFETQQLKSYSWLSCCISLYLLIYTILFNYLALPEFRKMRIKIYCQTESKENFTRAVAPACHS